MHSYQKENFYTFIRPEWKSVLKNLSGSWAKNRGDVQRPPHGDITKQMTDSTPPLPPTSISAAWLNCSLNEIHFIFRGLMGGAWHKWALAWSMRCYEKAGFRLKKMCFRHRQTDGFLIEWQRACCQQLTSRRWECAAIRGSEKLLKFRGFVCFDLCIPAPQELFRSPSIFLLIACLCIYLHIYLYIYRSLYNS